MRILYKIDGNQVLSEITEMEFVDSRTAIFQIHEGVLEVQITFPNTCEAEKAVKNMLNQGHANLSAYKAEYLMDESPFDEDVVGILRCPNCDIELPVTQEEVDRGFCFCPNCHARLTFMDEEPPKHPPLSLH